MSRIADARRSGHDILGTTGDIPTAFVPTPVVHARN